MNKFRKPYTYSEAGAAKASKTRAWRNRINADVRTSGTRTAADRPPELLSEFLEQSTRGQPAGERIHGRHGTTLDDILMHLDRL